MISRPPNQGKGRDRPGRPAAGPGERRPGAPLPLGAVLGRGLLRDLEAHCHRVQRLEEALSRWLDEPLKSHCRVANVTDERIVLQVESPVWSQRLRFLLPEIERYLSGLAGSRRPPRVRIRVAPLATVEPPRTQARPRALSKRASQALTAAARGTPDERLRQVLQRLACRTGSDGGG